ncbi:hypothetical protein ACI3KS_16470 [Microbacterium sp. ZW T5_45]|uniref:hypothetical protein n=1 Tax=Microbacterium sp. ZW T5_45 TaxID=3378080 RepID=UPI0038528E15
MSDDRDPNPSGVPAPDAVAAPEPVVAPPTYDPSVSALPSQHGVPLAPPLSGVPDAPAQAPASPQAPDYAPAPPFGLAPGYPQGPASPQARAAARLPPYANAGYPASGAYAGNPAYPASAPPSSTGSNRTLWIVLGTVGGFLVLSIIGVVMLFSLILRAVPDPVALPSGIPSTSSDPFDDPSDDPTDNPFDDPSDSDVDAQAGEELAQLLDDTKAKYLQLRDSGELWQQIPDTEFNRTALSAFLFFVADMKVATIWGITAEQADEYTQRVAMLEERLLAQQPLGDDIRMTTDRGVFTYDGETGEGGWAEG